jgi:class 3 adenylate cyclase
MKRLTGISRHQPVPVWTARHRCRPRGTDGSNPSPPSDEEPSPLFRTRRQNSRFGRSGALNARAGAGFEVGLVKTIDYRRAMPTVRRLAAILAADVAGYSRLMGADEEGTHERLKAHLRGLIEPKIKEHRGHTVKNTGDGLLAEFPSVVDAVRCAVEVQRGMAERNAETPEDKRLTFRIGVNLGDVIVEEHDIFGDGVNVAARLEGLAEPGGICISRVDRRGLEKRSGADRHLDYGVGSGGVPIRQLGRQR